MDVGEAETLVTILMADDDAEDCDLVGEALKKSKWKHIFRTVRNGQELLEYLRHQGAYQIPGSAPRPSLIFLDLNMPMMDGRDALREIKADPGLCNIPIIVMTSSDAENDIFRSYELGSNSFITKPKTFNSLVDLVKNLCAYWLEVVELPREITN